jgi:hypothetical protein
MLQPYDAGLWKRNPLPQVAGPSDRHPRGHALTKPETRSLVRQNRITRVSLQAAEGKTGASDRQIGDEGTDPTFEEL